MAQEQLMSIREWSTLRFTKDSMPARQIVARWCQNGKVPAKMIGNKWFIIANKEKQQTGNNLVDKVLAN